MAPINKKFRAVDALKHTSSSSCSSTSPPSSPSVSSPPSVIVRNDCSRVEANGPYSSSDSEQIDSTRYRDRRRHIETIPDAIISHHHRQQQDLPIDATIGAKIDATFNNTHNNLVPSDSKASNDDSNDTLTQRIPHGRDTHNSRALEFAGLSQAPLFSPPSPLHQHHPEDQNSVRRRSQSLHSQQNLHQRHNKHSDLHSPHHLLHHSESNNINSEAPLHHHLHSHLHIQPQHLNIHHSSNVPNAHCIVPSPSNSPFDPTLSPHRYNSFPFSSTSSGHSLSPSPGASVITENPIGHHKESSSSSSSSSGPSGYSDSVNGIRTRADNSNSEPFPPEKSSKITCSKRTTRSPPPLSSSSSLNDHRHVSFRSDAPSPTPSKSSTTSDRDHKSSQSGKGQVDKASEEYRLRRERNNIAVRKSRSKSKVKFIQTIDRMNQLEEENNKLHARIDEMSREVTVLRLLVAKYHRVDPRRIEHLEHLLAIEMSQEITMLDDGNNRLQVRNYEDSRSNINPFYKER